jgi:WD40 repeat protein
MMILLGLTSGCVLLYSLATGKVECELQGPGLSAAVRSLAWAQGDASGVYSGCADGTIAHWNLPSKQLSRY